MPSYLTSTIIAGSDHLTTRQGEPLTVSVDDILANDSGPGSSPLTLTSIYSWATRFDEPGVQVTLNDDGTILFDPGPYFAGQVSFDYRVTDGSLVGDGTIYLSVSAPVGAPIFTSADTVTIPENSVRVRKVTADPNGGGPVKYSLTGYDSHGLQIDPKTGVITVTDFPFLAPLDYETRETLWIGVVATNAAGSTYQSITVNLIDIVGQSIRGTSHADRIDRNHGINGKHASDDGDRINGYGGNDRIWGLRGDDTLIGGSGRDVLTGGHGRDVFVFKGKLGASNVDRISDFNIQDDSFQLDNSVMRGIGKEGALKAPRYHQTIDGTADAHDKSDRIIFDRLHKKLYYDADGSGHKEPVLIATLDAHAWIFGASQFEII